MANFAFLKEFEKNGDPKPKKSKVDKITATIFDPRNWGLKDYSHEDSFNQAFKLARKAGEREFIYNGRRYNTQSNESPDVQYKKFGNVNQILEYGPRDKQNLTDIIDYYRKAHNDTTVNGGKRGRGKFEADLLDLHKEQGNPGVYFDRNGGKSYYRPFTNNMTLENEEDYLDELAHAKQSNNPFKDGYEYLQEKISGKSRYSREGTTENEAHSVIKPKLYKRLGLSGFNNHYRDSVVNAELIKRGIYLDKQVEQDYSDTITYDPDGKPVDWTKVKKHSDGIYKNGGMAKFKYLRGGRVFESDKVYNLPQIGPDGKLVTPKGTTKKIAPEVEKKLLSKSNPEMKAWEAKNMPWLNPERRWNGGDTVLGKGDDLYINDAGNLSKKPLLKPKNPLLELPLVKQDNTARPMFDRGGWAGSPDSAKIPKAKKNIDFGNILGTAAPFLDNIGNAIATSKTPNIPEPVLTSAPRLATKFNINPQIRRVENDTRALSQGIDQSTSSAGVANANKGSLLANKLRAVGDLEANKQNFETQMGNQAAFADYQARRDNNQLINVRNQQQMMRQDDINTRYADVVGNFGDDIANINRERNMMARDRDAMRMLMKTNPDAVYQFADTDTFKTLYKNDEPALRKLILSQKGSAQKAKLAALYKQLYNTDFTE